MSQLPTVWATFRVLTAKITHIGLWSRHLVTRPGDWGPNMIVAGSAHSPQMPYQPPQSLVDFLNSDVPIIAISFGTYPLPMPQRLLWVISKAVQLARVKAVFCLGGSAGHSVPFDPKYTHIVDEIPHDWLLPQIDGFFHHGGAGHVAAGLKHGVPTLIMPLAHDQGYWAARVASLNIGPAAIDHKRMTPESLACAFKELLSEHFKTRSKQVGLKVSQERDGSEVAAEVVAESLSSVSRPNCAVIPALPSTWKHYQSGINVSGGVVACLVSQGIVTWEEFDLPAAFDWTEEWKRVRLQMPMSLVLLESIMMLVTWVFSILSLVARRKARKSRQKLSAAKLSKRVEGKIRQSEQGLRMLLGQAEDRSAFESNIVRKWKGECDVSMKEMGDQVCSAVGGM
jgi:sterol 3beta-glucosyltransferase